MGAYASQEEMDIALQEDGPYQGIINPGNRLACMDASTLSEGETERELLLLKDPRFADLEPELKRAFLADSKFQQVFGGAVQIGDKASESTVQYDERYPKMPQYPSGVMVETLPEHRWYMAEQSQEGDGYLMYLDQTPHTATFEQTTHPRLSVETRVLVVDVLKPKPMMRMSAFLRD